MATLSLCMIVKNEAAHLERCLDAVGPLVDEIVIADTGSVDRTIEIAARRADRLVHFPWCDDFSAARNFVADQASGDWILSIDADETIAGRDHPSIRAALQAQEIDAVESIHRHYLADGAVVGWKEGAGGYDEGRPYPGYFDVPCRRLFRRDSRLRWQHAVHEEIVSIDPVRPLRATHAPWVVHHFGKVDDRTRLMAKADMYLRIGMQKAADRPSDVLAQYELGIQLQELQRWEEALASFRRADEIEPGFRQTDLYVGICLSKLKQPADALTALERARRTSPTSLAEIALEEGNVYLATEEHEKAAKAYRAALTHMPSLAAAAFNLAVLALRVPDRSEAGRWLDRALKHGPSNAEARILRATLRYDRQDAAGALEDLAFAPRDPRAARLRARIHLESGRAEDAAAALAEGPEDVTGAGRTIQGAVALARGDAATALRALESAWPQEQTVETALNLSTARLATGDPGGALVAIGEALGLDPAHSTARERHRALSPTEPAVVPSCGDRPLKIFFWHPHSLQYDGSTPRTSCLGGTESAVVYLAEALTARGHSVSVFNVSAEATSHEGVAYAPWQQLPAQAARQHPDVVIAIRHWDVIGRNRFAPLQMFWTGDAYDQPYLQGLHSSLATEAIDLVVLQSQWQIETIARVHGVAPWRIAQTPYGYSPTTAAAAEANPSPRPRRLAYASTPFRGLDVLLDLFPAIRARCPNAELKVFSSMRVYGMAAADDRARFDEIYRRAEQPGVELVGSIPQPRLAEELASCRLLAYPNHWPETFCIAAIEAQAAGCPVLTSAIGALPETVGDGGLCLQGDPRSATFQRAFVDAAVDLLMDDDRWAAFSRRARDRSVAGYSWSAIAKTWEGLVLGALANDAPEVHRVSAHLLGGRATLAARMVEKIACPSGVNADAWRDLVEITGLLASNVVVPVPLAARVTHAFGSLRRTHALECALGRQMEVERQNLG